MIAIIKKKKEAKIGLNKSLKLQLNPNNNDDFSELSQLLFTFLLVEIHEFRHFMI